MHQHIAILIADALESEQYKQGKSCLRSGNLFCCLGVTCDLYKKVTGKGEWALTPGDNIFHFVVNGKYSSLNLPKDVMEWAGIKTQQGLIAFKDSLFNKVSLANYNDSGFDFPTIARIIRERYELI